jgi:seryl-tRNA synthetase
MHDINFIRNQPEVFDRLMKRRGFSNLSAKILELDKLSRSKKTQTQQLKEEANRLAKLIPIYKKEGKDIKELLSKASELKAEIQAQANEEEVSGELKNFLLTLPNILQDEVVDGISDWEAHYGEIRGQRCLRTSYNNNIRGVYAGIGFSYDEELDIFIAPVTEEE